MNLPPRGYDPFAAGPADLSGSPWPVLARLPAEGSAPDAGSSRTEDPPAPTPSFSDDVFSAPRYGVAWESHDNLERPLQRDPSPRPALRRQSFVDPPHATSRKFVESAQRDVEEAWTSSVLLNDYQRADRGELEQGSAGRPARGTPMPSASNSYAPLAAALALLAAAGLLYWMAFGPPRGTARYVPEGSAPQPAIETTGRNDGPQASRVAARPTAPRTRPVVEVAARGKEQASPVPPVAPPASPSLSRQQPGAPAVTSPAASLTKPSSPPPSPAAENAAAEGPALNAAARASSGPPTYPSTGYPAFDGPASIASSPDQAVRR